MRNHSVPRPALLGLLALAACRQSTSPPGAVAASPSATPSLSASAGVTVTGLQGSASAGTTCPDLPACRRSTSPPVAVAASPSATPSLSAAAPGAVTGLQGTISAGPTCPVERVDSPCPPRPLSAEVDARDPAGHIAAMTRSGSDGRYRLPLPPGQYTLTVASSGSFPRCPTPTATVTAGRLATVDISCDTGIR